MIITNLPLLLAVILLATPSPTTSLPISIPKKSKPPSSSQVRHLHPQQTQQTLLLQQLCHEILDIIIAHGHPDTHTYSKPDIPTTDNLLTSEIIRACVASGAVINGNSVIGNSHIEGESQDTVYPWKKPTPSIAISTVTKTGVTIILPPRGRKGDVGEGEGEKIIPAKEYSRATAWWPFWRSGNEEGRRGEKREEDEEGAGEGERIDGGIGDDLQKNEELGIEENQRGVNEAGESEKEPEETENLSWPSRKFFWWSQLSSNPKEYSYKRLMYAPSDPEELTPIQIPMNIKIAKIMRKLFYPPAGSPWVFVLIVAFVGATLALFMGLVPAAGAACGVGMHGIVSELRRAFRKRTGMRGSRDQRRRRGRRVSGYTGSGRYEGVLPLNVTLGEKMR